jgi:hypothetical protein
MQIFIYTGNLQGSQAFHETCPDQGFLTFLQVDAASPIDYLTDLIELVFTQLHSHQIHETSLNTENE